MPSHIKFGEPSPPPSPLPTTNGFANGHKHSSALKHPRPSTSNSTLDSPSPKKKNRIVNYSDTDDEDSTSKPAAGPSFTKSGKVDKSGVAATTKKAAREAREAEKRRLEAGRRELPIWNARDNIVKAVKENDTVVILGETGSGKTTQVPQFLMDSDSSLKICCTQPRRVAAITLAQRVAAESASILGHQVGYTVRFDDRSTPNTRLKYMTDGALLAEMLGDGELERYDVVMLDEAHERTLRTDMLLGFLKDVQNRRKGKGKELKVIVMSATIDAKRFSDFFDGAPVLYVKGRQHSVQLRYAPEPQTDYVHSALKTVFEIHLQHPPGDILVFLPGQEDIENLAASIKSYLPSLEALKTTKLKGLPGKQYDAVLVCPLFAKLAQADQEKAFAPAPPKTRKVILSTNVAETSVTIPGVVYVIDSGMAKEKEWHGSVGIDSLVTETISQSSAQQRLGRAGRERSGFCYRLYTEKTFYKFSKTTKPEIQRVSLVFALLHLLAAKADPFTFQYLDPPERDAVSNSLLTLLGLGALTGDMKLTPTGSRMAQLPLSPQYSTVLLSSFHSKCPSTALSLVSLLSCRDILLPQSRKPEVVAARKLFEHRTGDHWALILMLRSFEELEAKERKEWCKANHIPLKAMKQVLDTRAQLKERCEKMGLAFDEAEVQDGEEEEVERVLSTLVTGLWANTALLGLDGKYRQSVSKEIVTVHPGSFMHSRKAPAIVYDELVLTTKTYARGVSAIELVWMRTKAPNVFNATQKGVTVDVGQD